MITRSGSTPVAIKLALRELRGGIGGFKIFMACLILGVAAIASIGSLTLAIQDGMEREGQTILGGDLEINQFQKAAGPDLDKWAKAQGTLSKSARFRTMGRTEQSNDSAVKSTLIELRAVDNLYPLYGEFITVPALDTKALLEKRGDTWGTAIDPMLADKLDVTVGDILNFGAVKAEVRAFIDTEPDKANLGFQLGPSAFLHMDALDETGLVTTGSLINFIYKVRLPQKAGLKDTEEALKKAFPDATWRVRSRATSAPGLRRFIEQMGMFLTLVGISALVVGGVGVGNAVRGYMDRKTKTIATLKILGAHGSVIFQTYFFQVVLMGLVAIVIGLGIGALLPGVLATFLPDSLPVTPGGGIYPTALMLAAVYGLMITVAFTVWPLGKARDLPAVQLFRTIVVPTRRWPRMIYMAAIFGAAFVVILLAVSLSDNRILSGGFMIGAAITLGILRLLSWLIEKGAAKAPRPKNPLVRMAIANLHRPGAATGAVVISLGLGLTLFAGLALIQGNLDSQLQKQVPDQAPSNFMLDIQRYEAEEFVNTLTALEGVNEIDIIPNLRGRVTKLNGVAAQDVEIAAEVRWVLRGDRGLTYVDTLNKGSTIVDGTWWPEDYKGAPEVSLGKEQADGLGLKVGDTITIAVLGREITATVRSLREINWGTFGFNFVIMFDPNTLKAAPHTFMATMKATTKGEVLANKLLTANYPSVTVIRMKEVLTSLNKMVGQISAAVQATALVSIVAGVLVLAGAIAAGFRQRVYESVILKVVGAVRAQILKAYLLEYALIGIITAVIALGLGSLVGYLVVAKVMEMSFTFLPVPMIQTVSASLVVTVTFGIASSFRALSIKPNEILRNE
jgi:putative ABC transport system permease protein